MRSLRADYSRYYSVSVQRLHSTNAAPERNEMIADPTKPNVRVIFGQMDTGEYGFRVLVTSQVRSGLKAYQDIIPGRAGCELNSVRDIRRAVVIGAGACAEQLCDRYGDKIEPSECARLAGPVFDACCAQIAEKGVNLG